MTAIMHKTNVCDSAQNANELSLGLLRLRVHGSDDRRYLRTPGDGDEGFDLLFPRRATIRFCQGDRSGFCHVGSYVLLRRDEFYEISSKGGLDRICLSMTMGDIATRIPSIDEHCGMQFEQSNGMARILFMFTQEVADTYSSGAPEHPDALGVGLMSFISLVIGSEKRADNSNSRVSRLHLRRRIYQFVENNLSDSDLSPRRIAEANNISCSYLYSIFADNKTTVSQFVQARRLQRAYELLVTDPTGGLMVSQIAYMVGFKNVSHFSRTFTRHFKVAPRDAKVSGLISSL